PRSTLFPYTTLFRSGNCRQFQVEPDRSCATNWYANTQQALADRRSRHVRFHGPVARLPNVWRDRQQPFEATISVALQQHRRPGRIIKEDESRAYRLRTQPHSACDSYGRKAQYQWPVSRGQIDIALQPPRAIGAADGNPVTSGH